MKSFAAENPPSGKFPFSDSGRFLSELYEYIYSKVTLSVRKCPCFDALNLKTKVDSVACGLLSYRPVQHGPFMTQSIRHYIGNSKGHYKHLIYEIK